MIFARSWLSRTVSRWARVTNMRPLPRADQSKILLNNLLSDRTPRSSYTNVRLQARLAASFFVLPKLRPCFAKLSPKFPQSRQVIHPGKGILTRNADSIFPAIWNGLFRLASPKGILDQANQGTWGKKLTENIWADEAGNQPHFRSHIGFASAAISLFYSTIHMIAPLPSLWPLSIQSLANLAKTATYGAVRPRPGAEYLPSINLLLLKYIFIHILWMVF